MTTVMMWIDWCETGYGRPSRHYENSALVNYIVGRMINSLSYSEAHNVSEAYFAN